MKKIYAPIIALLVFFSIANSALAVRSIDDILWLPNWPESGKMSEIGGLESYSFKNAETQRDYMDFKRVNQILQAELIRKYKNEDFSQNQIGGIIENYKKTIYYTNQLFYYRSLKEEWISGDEIDAAIASAYSNIRVYYTRMKNIIKESY